METSELASDNCVSEELPSPDARRAFGVLGALITAQVFVIVLGTALGFGIFRLFQAGSTSSDPWADLGWALLGLCAALLVGVVAFPITFARLLRRWAPTVHRKRSVLVAVLAPVGLSFALSAVPDVSAGAASLVNGLPFLWWIVFAAVVDMPVALLVLWIAGCLRGRWVLGGFAVLIVMSFMSVGHGHSEARTYERNANATAMQQWTGPVYAFDGRSLDYPVAGWAFEAADRPYGTEAWETWKVLWRKTDAGGLEHVNSIAFSKVPVREECTYESSCVLVGSSKAGPVWRKTYMKEWEVDVPGGHIAISSETDDAGAQRIADALQPIDKQAFLDLVVSSEG